MISIAQSEEIGDLPVKELEETVKAFAKPLLERLPDQRLRVVGVLMILGIVTGQSPLITHMARGVREGSRYVTEMARRLYRFIWNKRFSHQTLQVGLYAIGQNVVVAYEAPELIVAIDPVNFEKPYTHELEGVSTIYKSTPSPLTGSGRLTRGYPSLTAYVVNLPEPVVTYANWFSYQVDFLSENAELRAAASQTRTLYPLHKLWYVGDSGLDDQHYFEHLLGLNSTFIIRVGHENRWLEVYNERLSRWEREHVGDLIATTPTMLKLEASFTHARKTRTTHLRLGWLKIRLPDWKTPLWLLAIHHPDLDRDFGLLTNRPILNAPTAETVLTTWRYRPQIEHTYRFDQEAGLDVEDMRVHTLESMRRVFLMVLLTAAFVYHLDHTWQPQALHWLRSLGGKLGFHSDLAGISAVFVTAATLAFVRSNPFPRPKGTSG